MFLNTFLTAISSFENIDEPVTFLLDMTQNANFFKKWRRYKTYFRIQKQFWKI